VGWDEGRGINNLPKFLDSSPSPLPCGVEKLAPQGKPSPVKGKEVFWTFCDSVNYYKKVLGGMDPDNPG
jgi:hypothetical protein